MGKINADSFTEAFHLYLKELDKAYEELKTYHAAIDILNSDWPKYKAAREKFDALQGDIFLFKSVWYEARELKESQESNG